MKLSIITINYNNAVGLEKTIQSVLPILNDDIEYIIVDGASTDESSNVIDKYSQQIAKSISEADKGVYNAMNKGTKMATGEHLLFLNSGDIISNTPQFEEALTELNGEGFIYANLEINNPEDGTSFIKSYPDTLDIKYLFEDSLPHMASFIKRELLSNLGGYNEDYKIISDWSFFFDVTFIHNASYKHINYCFSTFYTDGLSSLVENREKLWTEREKHIKEFYPQIYSLYLDWKSKKEELYKLKYSQSVKTLKRIGLLKWLKY